MEKRTMMKLVCNIASLINQFRVAFNDCSTKDIIPPYPLTHIYL